MLSELEPATTGKEGAIVEQLDVTLMRGLKIWWSFAWRTMVLSMLILIPLEAIVMGHFLSMGAVPTPGSKGLDPQQAMRMAAMMLVAWPLLMAVIVVLQAQAMRWMLRRARWSDFKVVVVPQ